MRSLNCFACIGNWYELTNCECIRNVVILNMRYYKKIKILCCTNIVVLLIVSFRYFIVIPYLSFAFL